MSLSTVRCATASSRPRIVAARHWKLFRHGSAQSGCWCQRTRLGVCGVLISVRLSCVDTPCLRHRSTSPRGRAPNLRPPGRHASTAPHTSSPSRATAITNRSSVRNRSYFRRRSGPRCAAIATVSATSWASLAIATHRASLAAVERGAVSAYSARPWTTRRVRRRSSTSSHGPSADRRSPSKRSSRSAHRPW